MNVFKILKLIVKIRLYFELNNYNEFSLSEGAP